MSNFQLKLLVLFIAMLPLFALQGFSQAPTISTFTPAKGGVGTAVTITGTNFNATAGNNIVYFGATRAQVISANATALNVRVPAGATFQPISVLNTASRLTGYSAYPFHTTFPTKNSITALDFDARVDFAAGNEPNGVALTDLDGDGKTDMVVTNQADGTISIYRNTATPGQIDASTFAPPFQLPTEILPTHVEIGDLDGDGKPDIVVASFGLISIYRNTSATGTLNTTSFAAAVNFSTDGTPNSLKITDLDGDGKPDIAIGYVGFAITDVAVSLMRNTSVTGSINPTSFATSVPIFYGNGYFSVNTADLTNDGKPELIVVHTVNHVVRVFKNTAVAGTLNASSFPANVGYPGFINPLVSSPGDIDGNGSTDLLISNFGDRIGPEVTSSFFLSVLLKQNNNNDITTASFATQKSFPVKKTPQSSTLGDLDGDGLLDAVNVNFQAFDLSIHRNTSTPGNAILTHAADLPALPSPVNIKIADIDGDGRPDIIVVNITSNIVSVFRNNANNEQSLIFPPLNSVIYGTADFPPGATSNNPTIPITYTSSNPAVATITADGKIHVVGVGTATITASQAGNANFPPATPVSQVLTVTRAPLTIQANEITRAYDTNNPPLTYFITGLVNGDTEASINNSITLSTTAVANSVPGSYPITITGNATSANYTITYVNAVLTVKKLLQTIWFNTPAEKYFGDADYLLTATASSGLPVTFTNTDASVITITNDMVHILKTGVVNIIATQAGDEIYEPASVTKQLTIIPLPVIIKSNTITPNGDGINDTWIITGLDEGSGRVSIFNRNGGQVFQSRGYPVPFNGTRNGSRLPGGVYYYVINFFDGRKPISGSLTIIY